MDFQPIANWGTVATLFVFAAGYFVRWALDANEARRARRAFYLALLAEVRLNVRDLKEAIAGFPSASAFSVFLAKDPNNRPHIISTYMSDIFDANVGMLSQLPDILIKDVISFYNELESISEAARSFDRPSFVTVSQTGKEAAVAYLFTLLKTAEQKGNSLVDAIKLQLNLSDSTS